MTWSMKGSGVAGGEMEHYPVMKKAVLTWLNLKKSGVYIDATCGCAGHSEDILKTGKGIYLLGIDKDPDAVSSISVKLAGEKSFKCIHGGFENLKYIAETENIDYADGVLFDLGFSTKQITDKERGFSFQFSGPLDMRYDRQSKITAGEIINIWGRKDLIWIFTEYGEIRRAEKIVKKILDRRKERKFETTKDFADFIARHYREKKKIHPATKFFMALRIAVNNELEVLNRGLMQAEELVRAGGRIVVISFNSLEDRKVKFFFKNRQKLRPLTKKPVLPSKEEIEINPESRSAKLRAAEKI
jgi:16S rRNA (cytosine1402-N4)-methyltransferase